MRRFVNGPLALSSAGLAVNQPAAIEAPPTASPSSYETSADDILAAVGNDEDDGESTFKAQAAADGMAGSSGSQLASGQSETSSPAEMIDSGDAAPDTGLNLVPPSGFTGLSSNASFGTPTPSGANALTTSSPTPSTPADASGENVDPLLQETAEPQPLQSMNLGGGGSGGEDAMSLPAAEPQAMTAAEASAWTSSDIGTVGTAGSTQIADGTFRVAGAGAGITGNTDAFRYVSQPLSGDGQLVARISALQNTGANAQAGLMIRDGTGAQAAFAGVAITASGNAFYQRRGSTGGGTITKTTTGVAAPQWAKIVKKGIEVTGWVSADGYAWRFVGSSYMTSTASTRVGLAVTSGTTAQANTATFDGAVLGAVTSDLPTPWSHQDVGGNMGLPGGAAHANGRYEVTGAGSNVLLKSDNFRYAYRSFSGDGTFITRVESMQNTSPEARAGIMIRESVSGNSKNVFLAMTPRDVDFNYRSSTNGGTTTNDIVSTGPVWLKMVRAANTFTGYTSSDGTTWTQRGSVSIAMNASLLAGLGVCSHDTAATCTAVFTDVSVNSAAGESGPTVEIGGAPASVEGSNYQLALNPLAVGPLDAWSIAWGDGTTTSLPGTATSATHAFPDGPTTYVVQATATKGTATHTSDSLSVSVDNAPRTPTIAGYSVLDEGAPYVLELSSLDPGTDTVQYWDINWGDGSAVQRVTGSPATVDHYYAAALAGATITATATDEDGTYAASNSVSFTTVPTKPSGVVATALSANSVRVDWKDSSQVRSGFTVEQSTDGSTYVPIATVGPTVESYTATGLSAYTRYHYRVRANGSQGSSVDSTADFATTAPSLSIAGAAEVNEGAAYALTLDAGTTAGVTGWVVDWGDGTTSAHAAGATSASHVYGDGPSQFTISATASTTGGAQLAAGTTAVRVRPVAPSVLISGPAIYEAGASYALGLQVADAGLDTVSEWRIDWGDGSGIETIVGNPTSASHVYQGTRTYVISATAVDEDGSYRTNALSVTPGTGTPTGGGGTGTQQPPTAGVLLVEPDGTLNGWTVVERGGSASGKGGVTNQGGNLVLREGDSFEIELRRNVSIPSGTNTLRFVYSQLNFDADAERRIGDAFEVAFVDASGLSIVPTHAAARDSFLNVGERAALALGADANVTGSASVAAGKVVDLDVSTLAGRTGTLVLRLVNQDAAGTPADTATTVTLVGKDPTTPPSVSNVVVAPNGGDEGGSVTLTATYADPNGSDAHTARVFWGDMTWSDATINPATRTLTATHVYADNGTYAPRVEVNDGTGIGAATGAVTVANVAPTLTGGVRFETITQQGQRKLAAVLSGSFTDPGFTRVAAGTAETFKTTIEWGDGAVETVDATVTQGSDGQLTLGRFSGSHIYKTGGIYTAKVTVADDDGGERFLTFRYGVMIIQVVSQVNLKSSGQTPVKIFNGPGFNPNDIVASSLRFGPAGAVAAESSVSGNAKFAMTHYSTQASGIRPTDTEAYLTGQLADGTFFVGMDQIRIVPGSQQGRNGVIPTGSEPKFFVADLAGDYMYRYAADGTAVGYFPTADATANVRGVASNSAGTLIYSLDAVTGQVAVAGPAGAALGTFRLDGLVEPVGLATDDVDLWAVDRNTRRILRYSGAALANSGTSRPGQSFALDSANASPSDVATDGRTIWVTDDSADKVFVYDLAGALLGSWALDAANADASGLTIDPTGGTDLWILDRADKRVYRYASGRTLRAGAAIAADSFALAAANGSPEAIADPPSLDLASAGQVTKVPAGSTVLITGKVTPASPGQPVQQVTVNGQAVQSIDAAGNFFAPYTVASGTQQVSVVARDASGASSVSTSTYVGTTATSGVDFDRLSDVTSQLRIDYGRTSYDDRIGALYAGFRVENFAALGDRAVGSPLLVVVKNIRVNGLPSLAVKARTPAGTTPDGLPYYDLSSLLSGGHLGPQSLSATGTLAFDNPTRTPFTYDLVFLAPVNRAPRFTSAPVVGVAQGAEYGYNSKAVDLDGDTVRYTLETGPAGALVDEESGRLTWTAAVAGNHLVTIRATDVNGASDVQSFLLTVLPQTTNRPPVLTTDPAVVAYAGRPYEYDVDASDPDGDALVYEFIGNSSGAPGTTTLTQVLEYPATGGPAVPVTLDADEQITIGADGKIAWTPALSRAGRRYHIRLHAKEASTTEHYAAVQAFDLSVIVDPSNRAPVIVTTPIDKFRPTISGPAGSSFALETTVRDFHDTHPDFERYLGAPTGLVGTNLGPDGTPVFTGVPGQVITSAETFDDWYHDKEGVNLQTSVPLTFARLGTSSTYQFSSNSFFPIDGELFGNEGRGHNYHFTLELHSEFTYQGGETFSFTGDDDLWVFIGGRRVIDLGGVHGSMSQSVALNDLGLTLGQDYSFDLFFAERRTSESNFTASTSIQLQPSNGYQYAAGAVDPDGDTLAWQLDKFEKSDGTPAGFDVDLDPQTGTLTWNPTTAQVGLYDVEISVSDGRGGTDRQTFQLGILDTATGQISGNVYRDSDRSGLKGPTEIGIQNWTAFADQNENGRLDDGEFKAKTDANGSFVLSALPAGTYPVVVVPIEDGWEQTAPTARARRATISANGSAAGVDFGFVRSESSNKAPVFTNVAPTAAVAGSNWVYRAQAFDPEGDPLVFDLTTAPRGMGIDPVTGAIAWRPTTDQVGEQTAAVRVRDGNGGSALQPFTVRVLPVNTAPEILNQPPQRAAADRAFGHQVLATDVDGDALTYALTEAPTGLTINSSTGLLAWATPAVGVFRVSIQVTDGRGGRAIQSFSLDVSATAGTTLNRAPSLITSSIPGPAVVDHAYDVRLEAADPDGDAFSFETVSGFPAWLSLSASGRMSGKPPVGTPEGPLPTLRFRILDARGASATYSVGLSVVEPAPPANAPPEITSSPTGPAIVGQAWSYNVAAIDPDGTTSSLGYSATVDGVATPMTGAVLSLTPGSVGSRAIVVKVTDAAGGWTTQSFTLTVIAPASPANVPPEITSNPTGPAVVGQPWSYNVLANDPDGPTGGLTYSATVDGVATSMTGATLSLTSGVVGSRMIVVKVTDAAGGWATQSFTLTVASAPGTGTQNRPPKFTSTPPADPAEVGQDYVYEATALDPDGDDITFSLVEGPAGMLLVPGTSQFFWRPTAPGIYPVKVAVVDQVGDGQVQSFDLQVLATQNRPPQILSKPTGPAVVGREYAYPLVAQDPDGDALTFALVSPPAGMLIHPTLGRLSWTPSAAQAGVDVHVVVRDSAGNEAHQRFALDAVVGGAVNGPPEILPSLVGGAVAGRPFQHQVLARDPNGDALSYRLDEAPAGMTIDAHGLVRWAVPVAGTVHVRFTVTDDRGASASATFDLPVSDNAPPQFISRPSSSVVAGNLYEYALSATDPNGDVLTYRLENAPAGMSLVDGPAGQPPTVTWTPGAAISGEFLVTVVVSDGRGGSQSQSYKLRVVPPVPNAAPQIVSTPRTSIGAGETYQYQVVATDVNADKLTYELIPEPPAGMTIDDAGLIRWTPAAGVSTSGLVEVRVKDAQGLSSPIQQFTIVVNSTLSNAGPAITSSPTGGAIVDAQYRYDVTAHDPDGDPVRFALLSGPVGMTLDADTGVLLWRPDVTQLGVASVRIAATDTFGVGTVQSFTLPVRATNTPPRITTAAVTSAVPGQTYAYAVGATDLDGDRLQFSVDAAARSAGMTIDPDTGLLTWPSPTAGSRPVIVSVSDGRGGVADQPFAITVATPGTNNEYPWIDDIQPRIAAAGTPYAAVISASDGDGDSLTFEVDPASQNAGVYVAQNVATGAWELRWDNPSGAGRYVVVSVYDRASETDPDRLGSYLGFTLGVRANAAPTIFSNNVIAVSEGATYRYDVLAEDPDEDPLTFAFARNAAGQEIRPAGMTIDAEGRIRWATSTASPASAAVSVVVSDPFGARDTRTFDVAVQPDTTGPAVEITFERNPVAPGVPVKVRVTAVDDIAVRSIDLKVGGVAIPLAADGTATYVSPSAAGNVTFAAIATDSNGNSTPATAELRVRTETDTVAPGAQIIAPSDGAGVTAPTAVTGILTDDVGIVGYRVEVAADAELPAWTEIHRVSYATPRTDTFTGTLATFDPTLLQNGRYWIRVTVEDAGGQTAAAETSVDVSGEMKLGNFKVSETDLQIPLSGIPITLTRSYDSLNRDRFEDFGNGWTLDLDVDLQEAPEQRAWFPSDPNDPDYDEDALVSVRVGPGQTEQQFTEGRDPSRDVFLTLPDGRRVKFTYVEKSIGGGLSEASFDSESGVSATLAIDGPNQLTYNPTLGFERWSHIDPTYGDTFDGSGLAIGDLKSKYDIPGYVLTLDDGTKMYIEKTERPETENREDFLYDTNDATDGIYSYVKKTYYQDSHVTRIVDANGNTLQVTPEGLLHSDGTGVRFTRDGNGRITQVTDATNDVVLEYGYDGYGDLTSVTRLVRSAANGQPAEKVTTRYSYVHLGGTSTHNLKAITSPSGKTPIINQYDEQGRLSATIDAFGKRIEYGHQIGDRREVVTDRLGQQTVYDYDDRGNVLQVTNPAGERTVYTYVPNTTYVQTETTAANTAQPLTKTYTYDAKGFRTGETYTVDGNTIHTIMEYVDTAKGEHAVSRMVDPSGIETLNTYDAVTGLLAGTVMKDRNGVVTSKTTYDAYDSGQPTRVTQWNTNANGDWVRYLTGVTVYDPQGRPIESRSEDAAGNSLQKSTRTYDANGNLIDSTQWIANATGTFVAYATTTNEYDRLNRVIKTYGPTINGLRNFTQTLYDADGQAYRTVDERGHVTESTYNSAGQVIATTTNLGTAEQQSTQVAYTFDGRALTRTDTLGNVSSSRYDRAGRLVQAIHADGTTSETVYDGAGRAYLTTDRHVAGQAARASRTLYDAAGRSVGSQRLDGVLVSVAADNPTALEAGRTYSASVASAGTVVSSTQTHYDAFGRVDYTIGADNQRTDTTYDAAGRPTTLMPEAYDAETGTRRRASSSSTYDGMGRVLTSTDARGHATSYGYDVLGRQTRVTFADGSFAEVGYDTLGRKLWDRAQRKGGDALRQTDYEYDVAGRLLAVVQPAVADAANNNAMTRPRFEYAYDRFGSQTSQTDPRGKATTFGYDNYGRRTSRTLPADSDGNAANDVERWTYDARGRVATRVDPKGQTTLYAYDDTATGGGRPDREDRFTGAVDATPDERTSYGYDPLGRRTTVTEYAAGNMTTAARVETIGLDVEGRTTSVDSPEGTVRYEYDAATGRHARTYTDATDTRYAYDELGRIKTATSHELAGTSHAGAPLVTSYAYNAAGSLESTTLPNGVTTDYAYDALNRLAGEVVADAQGDRLFDQAYTLRSDGQRDEVLERRYDGTSAAPTGTTRIDWNYDALGRLTREARDEGADGVFNDGDYVDAYAFDLSGNRRSRAHDAVGTAKDETIASSYNDRDQLMAEDSTLNGNDRTYAYDANGSLSVKSGAGPGELYGWDLRNRMASATVGGVATTFAYDDDGVRVAKMVNGTTTRYLNDKMNPTGYAKAIDETTAAGVVTRSYILSVDVAGQADAGGGPLYLVKDGHGTTRALMNALGSVVQVLDTDAYGNLLNLTADQASTDWISPDGRTDASTNLDYHLARYLDRRTGTFVSYDSFEADPDSAASLHKYVYSENNPRRNTDPSGLFISVGKMIAGISILGILAFTLTPATFYGRFVKNYGVNTTTSPRRIAIVRGKLGYLNDFSNAWQFISVGGFASDLRKAGHQVAFSDSPDEKELANIMNRNEIVFILSHGNNEEYDSQNKPFAGFVLGGTREHPNDKGFGGAEWITANELAGAVHNPQLTVVSPACILGATSRMKDAIAGKHFVTVRSKGNSADVEDAMKYVSDLVNGVDQNALNDRWRQSGGSATVDPANRDY